MKSQPNLTTRLNCSFVSSYHNEAYCQCSGLGLLPWFWMVDGAHRRSLQGTQNTIWCPYQVSEKAWDLTHLAENHCWCETRYPMSLYHVLSTRIPMLEESLTFPY